ncbi:MAG: N-6 DNA methylase, partial [Nitrosopumilus sp.]|nr:N-6 DNA methylase [Nitrosopumilus sp.]
QEINLITSSIARMNMFLHGIEDFEIVRGNTLSNPGLLYQDELKKFNVVLANPPYSIKAWDQKAWANDPYGRNIWGTPPQGTADYAFQQHIHKSLDIKNGRSIVLWPHGVLFRDAEAEMRKKMIETDVVDCVIGLGPNLFYNSPMESCLLICSTNKSKARKGKVLFINAVKEVRTEKTISYLDENHIQKIFNAYKQFKDEEGFAKVVLNKDVIQKDGNLNITLYVNKKVELSIEENLEILLNNWNVDSLELRTSITVLLKELQ